jgi:hypothetical protein
MTPFLPAPVGNAEMLSLEMILAFYSAWATVDMIALHTDHLGEEILH